MLVKDVNACSFSNWFRTFEKVTFRSVVLNIPADVLNYLRSDDTLVRYTEIQSVHKAFCKLVILHLALSIFSYTFVDVFFMSQVFKDF